MTALCLLKFINNAPGQIEASPVVRLSLFLGLGISLSSLIRLANEFNFTGIYPTAFVRTPGPGDGNHQKITESNASQDHRELADKATIPWTLAT